MSKAALLIWMVVLMGGMSLSPCYGVERAPRISDREIVEALTELKVGQRALNQRFEELREEMKARFEQVDKRFEQVDQRLGQMITLFIGMIAADGGKLWKKWSFRMLNDDMPANGWLSWLRRRHQPGSCLVR